MHVFPHLPCRQPHNGVSKPRNAAKCFAKTFPGKTTRRNALQRLFQAKQRDEMLCKDFSKQNNAMKCFAKTFPSKTTRRNALQRPFPVFRQIHSGSPYPFLEDVSAPLYKPCNFN